MARQQAWTAYCCWVSEPTCPCIRVSPYYASHKCSKHHKRCNCEVTQTEFTVLPCRAGTLETSSSSSWSDASVCCLSLHASNVLICTCIQVQLNSSQAGASQLLSTASRRKTILKDCRMTSQLLICGKSTVCACLQELEPRSRCLSCC